MERMVRRRGLRCIQYPTGMAPRSSSTGSVASVKTMASSGHPDLRSAAATFNPSPEALIESSAAREIPETKKQSTNSKAVKTILLSKNGGKCSEPGDESKSEENALNE